MERLLHYCTKGKDRVDGWLGSIDARILYVILLNQIDRAISGSVAEIGVHHGKSFILLCLALKNNEKAYAIDVFEQQELNLDGSGRGDRVVFCENLRRFGVDADSDAIKIDARSSLDVSPADIIDSAGRIRLFSIDGGHWRSIVRHDLHLAERVISDDGVIALDDILRPEWPEVTIGYYDWYENSSKNLVPFAIGFNKLYLCRKEQREAYAHSLMNDSILKVHFNKYYGLFGYEVPIFQRYLLPEFGVRQRVLEFARLYHPSLYQRMSVLREIPGKFSRTLKKSHPSIHSMLKRLWIGK